MSFTEFSPFIASAALVVSLWALRRTWKLQKLQISVAEAEQTKVEVVSFERHGDVVTYSMRHRGREALRLGRVSVVDPSKWEVLYAPFGREWNPNEQREIQIRDAKYAGQPSELLVTWMAPLKFLSTARGEDRKQIVEIPAEILRAASADGSRPPR